MSWDGFDHEEAARAADYWMQMRHAYESAGPRSDGGSGGGPGDGDGPSSSVDGLCWCRMGGVGVCSRDGAVFCREHRVLVGGKSYCQPCGRALLEEHKQERARRWQQRHDDLPAGGAEELRDYLRDSRNFSQDPRYRFDQLDSQAVEATVLRVLADKGATEQETDHALRKWRADQGRSAALFEKLGGGTPETWPMPDPLRLTALERPLSDIVSRQVQQKRDAEQYSRQKATFRSYRRKVVALVVVILFFVAVAAVVIGAGIARHDMRVAGMSLFTLIPILLCAVGISSLNTGKPHDPDKPFLGYYSGGWGWGGEEE